MKRSSNKRRLPARRVARHRSKLPPRLREALKSMAREMNASSQELAGQIMERCQTIESLMKLHIVRSDPTKTLEQLEKRTFGQLLQMFRPHSKDEELNSWLNTLLELRNDVAHSFFVEEKLLAAELSKEGGDALFHLNHKVLRKGLRITEICHASLKKLLTAKEEEPTV